MPENNSEPNQIQEIEQEDYNLNDIQNNKEEVNEQLEENQSLIK